MRKEQGMDEVIESSGNVYTDIGTPDPEVMLIKAQLAAAIADSIGARKLTQQQAAEVLGMPQPKVSAMLNGRFRGISESKMMDCLSRLGRAITITISRDRPRSKRLGRIAVLQEA